MRAARWALVIFQFFFLNVFLPGHTRGAITIDGKSSVASCCEGRPGKKHSPTRQDRQCCAVCYLAAHYVPVEPFVFEMDAMERLREAHEAAVAQVCSLDFPTPFWPAGPPAIA